MNSILHFLKSKKGIASLFLTLLFLWCWFSLPSPLFNVKTSTVLEDKDGSLLAAQIAEDGVDPSGEF